MIRQATLEDAFALAGRLREADVEELKAVGFDEPLIALTESLAVSTEAYAYVVDDVVEALFGIASHDSFAAPWLLGSDDLFNRPKDLLKLPRRFLPRWLQEHGKLMNVVHANNTRSIRWLERLGFHLEPLQGVPFHKFSMEMSYV